MTKVSTFQLILLAFALALIIGLLGVIYLAAHHIDAPDAVKGPLATIVGALAMAFQLQAKADKADSSDSSDAKPKDEAAK
jgi:hypothetical protein